MVFYEDWLDTADQFSSPTEKLSYIYAILQYGIRGVEVGVDGDFPARIGYNSCKGAIKTNEAKRKGGSEGGAPEGNKNASKQPMVNSKQPMVEEKQPTINDNDNVNVNDNSNYNENVNEDENVSLAEKRQILHLFFLNNFYNPEYELERFYDHYESIGWNVGGRKVKSKLSRAKLWKPEDESDTHFTDSQMYFLHLLYSRCKTAEAKDVLVRTERIDEILDGSQKKWVFYTPDNKGLEDILKKYTNAGDLPKGITNIIIYQQ